MPFKKVLRNYYVVVSKRGKPDLNTMSPLRKYAITEFLQGATYTWKQCQEIGWRCIKVNLYFSEQLTLSKTLKRHG